MNESDSIRELRRLIDGLCDGSLSTEDESRLDDRLAADAEARKIYLQHMWMEAELYGLSTPLGSDIPGELGDLPAELQTGGGVDADATSSNVRIHHTFLSNYPWLSLAATVLIASFVSGWLVYQGANGRGLLAMLEASQTPPDSVEAFTGDQVARITGTRDCLWAKNQTGFGFGSTVRVGQVLRLEEGLAEVTFKNGARMVLEGPSAYLVPGRNDAKLLTGQMSAAIPRTAVGFTIHTDLLTIDNAGTQFGLVVGANGGNEVHVFKGPIHVRAIDTRGQEIRRVRLSATEATRLTRASTDFAKFSADTDRFVRTLAPTVGPSQGLLAVEEFNYPSGPLAWQNGGFGWAGAWADLDSANEPHEVSTNAVTEGSLEVGGELVSRGNRSIQTGQFNRIRRPLSTSLRGVFDVAGLVEDQNGMRLIGRDGTSVYISFLQRASEVDDVFYGFELNRSDGNLNRVLCIGNSAEGTGYGVSSNFNREYRGEALMPLYESLGEEDVQVHLFVIRIDYGADNRDRATLYRDPVSLLDEKECIATAVLHGNFAFDRISLGNFDGVKGKTHEVDEIRVGTSFAAVTGHRSSADVKLAKRIYPQGRLSAIRRSKSSTVQISAAKMNLGALSLIGRDRI